MILDQGRLDEVGRYLHLNPVRIAGLGLSKEDQRRARVLGCEDPGRELVSRCRRRHEIRLLSLV